MKPVGPKEIFYQIPSTRPKVLHPPADAEGPRDGVDLSEGKRSRTTSGRFRVKRGDTHLKTLRETYGLDFAAGLPGNMPLALLRAATGMSLSQMLEHPEAVAKGAARIKSEPTLVHRFGPGAGGGYPPDQVVPDGPGAGGGYPPDQKPPEEKPVDGPGAGGGYPPDQNSVDGPGAGGGYPALKSAIDGPGAGGGYPPLATADGPGAGGGYPPLMSVEVRRLATEERLAQLEGGYTQAHMQRASALAVGLAEAMGLPAEDRAALQEAGRFYDAGKLDVPTAVLDKTGRYTDEEFAEMKKHVDPVRMEGYFKLFAASSGAREAALYHHERFDGKGYPSGRAGEAIPLTARILAVADAFDSMTQKRWNREDRPDAPVALSPEAALEILRKNAGTQFDPAVVEAFARLKG